MTFHEQSGVYKRQREPYEIHSGLKMQSVCKNNGGHRYR